MSIPVMEVIHRHGSPAAVVARCRQAFRGRAVAEKSFHQRADFFADAPAACLMAGITAVDRPRTVRLLLSNIASVFSLSGDVGARHPSGQHQAFTWPPKANMAALMT